VTQFFKYQQLLKINNKNLLNLGYSCIFEKKYGQIYALLV